MLLHSLPTLCVMWCAAALPPVEEVRGALVLTAGEELLDAVRAEVRKLTGGSDVAPKPVDTLPGFVPAARLAEHPGYVGLDVAARVAVVVSGRRLRVVGDGAATVTLAAGAGRPELRSVLRPGEFADLIQLRRAAANRVATERFPPAKPRPPVVAKGALVVVGGGGAQEHIWKRFIDLAGGPDATIVVVPTASEERVPIRPIEVVMLQKHGAKNVVVLHTRDRQVADSDTFSKVLTTAGGVWFGGGRQWRFVDAYAGTLTEKRFHEVLDRGGAIGGSSAGASIQSEYMPRGHPLGNTVMAAEGYERGFGFLPGCAVDQHFFARNRTADMTGLMERYPQYLGIGIDEGTAIVVRGSVAEVIGKSKVGFYDYRGGRPAGETDYTAVPTGGRYDLARRKVLD